MDAVAKTNSDAIRPRVIEPFGSPRRRGVLLLIVLSTLTLFLMLGATYLAVARRARIASRGYADNVTRSTATGLAERQLVDEAFLTVVRGTRSDITAGSPEECLEQGDDLLGDKYGHNTVITGEVTAATVLSSSQALVQLTTANLATAPANASDLNGRVITFLMPGLMTSTRILQASGVAASPTLVVAAGPTVTGKQIDLATITSGIAASAGNTNILINGREFSDTGTNEPYDGFDLDNPLLTQIIPDEAITGIDLDGDGTPNEALSVNPAPIYGATTLNIDNDADGTPDSAFLDIGLPPIRGANGNLLHPRAAILVTDLDGRINLNAHGSGVDGDLLDAGTEMYPTVTASNVPLYQLPRGSGAGPAGITVTRSLVFGGTTEQAMTDNALAAISGLPQDTNTAPTTDAGSGREVPNIHGAQGRDGEAIVAADAGNTTYLTAAARPGQRGVNDNGGSAQSPDRWRAGLIDNGTTWVADDYFSNPGRFGSPFDFKGRLRALSDPATGQPVYYKPYWDEVATGFAYDNELIDDPYEMNLGRRGPRQGSAQGAGNTTDNLFSAADLEGLLRYYDSDSLKLSRRLVSPLGTEASEARLSVTTESWDTPAVVGAAWDAVIGPFATGISAVAPAARTAALNRVQDIFAPETLMGLKLDINRPFHDAPEDANGNGVLDMGEDLDGNGWLDGEPNDAIGIERRQLLAQQLYCLMVAIAEANGTSMTAAFAEQIAQYAINIVDFRDADSVMTPFYYDPTFGGGSTTWTAGSTPVWGCERPELIITETFAWHDRRTSYDVMSGAFSQSHRPEGIFYVELASPWSSEAWEYDGTNAVPKLLDEAVTGGHCRGFDNGVNETGAALRAEPVPVEFLPATTNTPPPPRPDLVTTTIDIEKTTASGDPVWRLASVKWNPSEIAANGTDDDSNGTTDDTAFGPDPVLSTSHAGSLWALDPSRSGGPPIDRVFYFAQPVANPATDLPCHGITDPRAIFWQTTSGGTNPSSTTYLTAGTPRMPRTPGAPNATATANFRSFKGRNGQFGTLTEPLGRAANGSTTLDPYDQLVKFVQGGSYGVYTPGMDPLTSGIDSNYGTWSSSPNLAIDAANDLTLLTNGTHDNYAVIYLQRLADPFSNWHATDNPYLTIDCMSVDLTVVNTDTGLNNIDDPAGGATQQAYRASSTQRGGATPASGAFDIWNRSPLDRTTTLDLNVATTFRTGAPGTRPAVAPPTSVGTGTSTHTLGGSPTAGSGPYPWLLWPNRPFSSAAELALVPIASPFHLTQRHSTGNTASVQAADFFHHLAGFFEASTSSAPWSDVTGRGTIGDPSLLDFVHVPSPYLGLRESVPPSPAANLTALEVNLGLDVLPLEQLSTFREPGRVNVNTITDARTWRAIFGSAKVQGDPDPITGGPDLRDFLPQFSTLLFGRTPRDPGADTFTPFATESIRDVFGYLPGRNSNTRQTSRSPGGFRDSFTGLANAHRETDSNAVFRYQTMLQMENLVTVRSNVFAVWITVGYFDAPAGGTEVAPIERNRGFYIVDRSIPVAYERGKDHNVRDAILLRRIIQ